MEEFSVLISVYYKEKPEYLSQSLQSIFSQTIPIPEVVLVKDGPLTKDLDLVIESFTEQYANLKVIELPQNVGLGKALNVGLLHCSYDIVARMDSDDICVKNRFELQINYLNENPTIAILGSWVDEFSDNINNIISTRTLPEFHSEIVEYAKFRCPLNHPSVIFRKNVIEEAGGYKDFYLFEDYYLWIRLICKNVQFANIQQSLILMRVNDDLFKRRGGFKYACSEIKLQYEFLKLGHISYLGFAKNVMIRFSVRIFPNKIRALIYRHFLRK